MRFLIDAQLPPALCLWLRARGHEAQHVFELGMQAAADTEVAARSAEDQAVLVTKDEDFRSIAGGGGVSLLWLRCGNISNAALVDWLEARWAQIEALLESGERVVEVI